MDKINFFPDNLNVRNKKIILRLDLNVPISNRIITDFTRITLSLPFLNKLIEKKAKIIIISHLGRPKGNKDPDLSLFPIYKFLKKKLETNVYFFMGKMIFLGVASTKDAFGVSIAAIWRCLKLFHSTVQPC